MIIGETYKQEIGITENENLIQKQLFSDTKI